MTCIGGEIASLQVTGNTDCNCVGVSRIVNNNNGSFTIVLTNGQSMTFVIPAGPAGSTPVIAFRVSGTILQYNVDGGSWINLFDLSSIGTNILYTKPDSVVTAGNSGFETLRSYTLPMNTLINTGDSLWIESRITCPTPVSEFSTAPQAKILFGGASISLGIPVFYNSINQQRIYSKITKTSDTTVRVDTTIAADSFFFAAYSAIPAFESSFQVATITVSSLITNDTPILVQGSSVVAGDISCDFIEITLVKFN